MAASFTSAENILRKGSEIKNPAQDFSLPPLPYAYEALEPHIDKMTMEIHHSKHHQGYVNNLNKALSDLGKKDSRGSVDEICKNISGFNTSVRNNAGGHFNHSLFWMIMKPNGGGVPAGALADAINSTFASMDNFKNLFSDKAKSVFGSGWAWLVVDTSKKLSIGTTPNQDNPLMDISDFKGTPILGLDVWEHAYYLKHQNKRADYISAWWNVVNWGEVSRLFSPAVK
ncbi:MAG: superoxide dismutase [Bacteroidia bacterium]|nr:superoxide dismutase [Bacteroidia bacterium]